MSDAARPTGNRRDFLAGKVLRAEVEWIGEQIAEQILAEEETPAPSAGSTVRLATPAMGTEFAVVMNPGPIAQVTTASTALEELVPLEQEMTVYQHESELSRVNRSAVEEETTLGERLFRVVQTALVLAQETDGAYDPTSGPLIDLWKRARSEDRIPTNAEIEQTLQIVGFSRTSLDEDRRQISFSRAGVELNLGGIGKGFALDELAKLLAGGGLSDWLMHGGKSSLLAIGENSGRGGWPVGVRNPLFPNKRLATLLLRDCGMSTSGAGIQFFRHEGKRYGHILDPRTGWPAEQVLSVTVLAPTAAVADALSTAFFVLGLEKTHKYCDNHPDVGVLLTPPPKSGSRLKIHAFNIPEQTLFLGSENELISEIESSPADL